ncbi:alpha/beta hydrolase [Rhodococcus sp. X156]|uniref:alpha/beta fold hydrolase n=1 Tax=Rhodococcus sp. X156 TaxID=2499145 RepID=UPI000FD6EFCC|nr:alpha/beta hydrolase [Rhodococcus sp. X156]
MSLITDSLIVRGARIAYRDHGEGEVVVLIHGTPSHSYEWRAVVPRVEQAGYRTIAYDLLGYGSSERPVAADTSVAGQTELLGAVLDGLGVTQATIIAHDIGGAIGLRFALAHPERVRRLMVLDTVSYDSWPSSTWQKIIDEHLDDYAGLPQDELDQLLTDQLRMTVHDTGLMTGETLQAYLAPHQSAVGRASFFEHQVRHYDSTYTEEITDQLGTLAMPVRIVWGEQDQWQPVAYAHRLHADIPGSELVVIPEAGHFVMEDAPERVAGEVLRFLGD